MSDFLEYRPCDPLSFDPKAIIAACYENDAHALLLEDLTLPGSFFDLSTGVAGELVQRIVLYGIRMAVVVADPARYSPPFQDFVRETSRGQQFRFFQRREDAIEWLESEVR